MGVDASAVSRVVGVTVEAVNFNVGQAVFLPQQVALIGQGTTALNATYALTPLRLLSAAQAASVYGFGSPLHLAARQLFPLNGDGIKSIPVTAYPLNDDGAAVIAAGSIDATGASTAAGSGFVIVGGIRSANIAIPDTTDADTALGLVKIAIAAVLEMPVIDGTVLAGELPLTAKWGGESGDDITLDVSNLSATGLVFSTTAMASGANNPDVTAATVLFGNKWESIIINCLNYEDTTALDAYETFGKGRWDTLVKKPLFIVTGSFDPFATVGAVTDTAARKDDFVNPIIPAPGSPELPFVIAARAVSRIAVTANNNPARNYVGTLDGLEAGTDGVQFLYASLDATLKLGASTTLIESGKIKLNDTITTYHPDGDPLPAFRYVVDLVKLQNIVFNVNLLFDNDEWKGAPLLPDADPTTNPEAKKPKDARTLLNNLADSLGLDAIISDPDFTKENTTVEINGSNPKRLDIVYPVKLSGNVEIVDVTVKFGFFFGS